MKLEPITTLNIDKQIFVVSELPQNVRNMVTLLDSWRQKESDMRDDLTQVQFAQQTLTQQLVQAVQAVLAQAQADADAAVLTPPAANDVSADPATNGSANGTTA